MLLIYAGPGVVEQKPRFSLFTGRFTSCYRVSKHLARDLIATLFCTVLDMGGILIYFFERARLSVFHVGWSGCLKGHSHEKCH
jgi:hypothetical protein